MAKDRSTSGSVGVHRENTVNGFYRSDLIRPSAAAPHDPSRRRRSSRSPATFVRSSKGGGGEKKERTSSPREKKKRKNAYLRKDQHHLQSSALLPSNVLPFLFLCSSSPSMLYESLPTLPSMGRILRLPY
ncbi:hypothetical protein DPEC_G00116540 [Dallia pectoralis]|uniref:Uncharacterized protein n=1 Tax=Dallia pectoralis TaxID=75939 RepID=A0ACC2GVB6_DALPE|nr:hypothetical protein DPEC_G00116540 [Dallia pectoralis]